MPDRIPVIALTGFLGAGKTTVLNHLLQQPGARVGVVINDFGDINVDAALVTGQIDEPVSIAGGCLCCLADDETLDEALAKLAQPRLALDVIIVEASGVAEPAALEKRIRFSEVKRVRPAGVVDVIDAVEYFDTVDIAAEAPSRFASASLVVINKCDRVPGPERDEVLARIGARVRESNPHAHVVHTHGGRLDANLLFDAASEHDSADQLPFAEAARAARADEHDHGHHAHARAATVRGTGLVDPARLIDLLEDPPAGAYRLKGQVRVRTGGAPTDYVVNLVGRTIHVRRDSGGSAQSYLVAIGHELDPDEATRRLTHALTPQEGPGADGLRRLQRHLRLSA